MKFHKKSIRRIEMKKLVLIVSAIFMLSGNLNSADIKINLIIPDQKVQKAKDGLLSLWPIPVDEEGVPTHTPQEWLDLLVKEWLRASVDRGLRKKAGMEAMDAVVRDNDVVQ